MSVDVEMTLEQPGRALAYVPANPMALVEKAIASDLSIEKLEKLLELQRQWEADQARKAYVQGMADFKAEAIIVIKDKVNKQYDSKYTSIDNLVNTVTPFLSRHGFSADWEINQASGIIVTCVMTHRLGFSKRFSLTVPPDTSGAKNALQQIKSSITYAKVTTFESACGIASKEANLDDDGNGSSGKVSMTDASVDDYIANILASSDEDELKSFYLEAAKVAEGMGDKAAVKKFADAKNKRWRELHPKPGGAR